MPLGVLFNRGPLPSFLFQWLVFTLFCFFSFFGVPFPLHHFVKFPWWFLTEILFFFVPFESRKKGGPSSLLYPFSFLSWSSFLFVALAGSHFFSFVTFLFSLPDGLGLRGSPFSPRVPRCRAGGSYLSSDCCVLDYSFLLSLPFSASLHSD